MRPDGTPPRRQWFRRLKGSEPISHCSFSQSVQRLFVFNVETNATVYLIVESIGMYAFSMRIRRQAPKPLSTGSTIVLVVRCVGYTNTRGAMFEGTVDGRVVVTSHQPFLDAARVLLSGGADPGDKLIMRHEGKDFDALSALVGVAAKLYVNETSRGAGLPSFAPVPEQPHWEPPPAPLGSH
jgi:hypothetical protein